MFLLNGRLFALNLNDIVCFSSGFWLHMQHPSRAHRSVQTERTPKDRGIFIRNVFLLNFFLTLVLLLLRLVAEQNRIEWNRSEPESETRSTFSLMTSFVFFFHFAFSFLLFSFSLFWLTLFHVFILSSIKFSVNYFDISICGWLRRWEVGELEHTVVYSTSNANWILMPMCSWTSFFSLYIAVLVVVVVIALPAPGAIHSLCVFRAPQ